MLREPRRGAHAAFATFAFNIAVYQLFYFLRLGFESEFFAWAAMLVAVSLPATAQRFFNSFLGDDAGPPPLSRLTVAGAVLFYVALCVARFVQPLHERPWFRIAFGVYVFAGLYLSLFYVFRRFRASTSRVDRIRLRYLLIGGLVAVTAMLLESVLEAFQVGTIFVIVYLYFLSQTLVRYRLLDLNELLGRMMVLGTLVLIVTLIYGVLVMWVGPDQHYFFNALVASTAILIVFDPLRTRVEGAVTRWMFQEKYELSRRIETLRADLVNIIDVRAIVPRVLSALEESRRVTHAAVYFVDPDGSGYDLVGHIGPRPETRLDAITHRGFLERLRRFGVITLEGLEREIALLKGAQGEEREVLSFMGRALEAMNGSVALALVGDDQLLGMLVLRDDRLREAYSSDEIELFRAVASSMGVTLQNSQVYERMKERERLAALGQMAAGLAHEIRNPLGSIKGAAQFLLPIGDQAGDASTREFLNIIVEEVNRLNRIVSQFLDYARPYRGEQSQLDVNEIVRKTVQLIEKEEGAAHVEISMSLADGLPPVRADPEQLRQVFLNLCLNALQAMPQGGRLSISTSLRRSTRRGAAAAFSEVRFRDTGGGISPDNLKNLFIPFFTTKEKGTGLGLPISQRIIENHGGTIEVRSSPGAGSTFTVLLPLEADAYASFIGKGPPPLPDRRTPASMPAIELPPLPPAGPRPPVTPPAGPLLRGSRSS